MLALPLLSEHNGVLVIERSFQSQQDWLMCEQFPVDSENYRTVEKIRLCFATACSIYVRRATSEDTNFSTPTNHYHDDLQGPTIHDFIKHISGIQPSMPGAHALVWPCFVAGAGATDPHHRAFFVEFMNRIYARTKFRNIPIAVQRLESIWASKGKKRWTQCLSETGNVLVM